MSAATSVRGVYRRRMVMLLTMGFAVGCDHSPTEPKDATYTLALVDGSPLPFPAGYGSSGYSTEIVIASGSLTLRQDGTVRTELKFRCTQPNTPTYSCSTEDSVGEGAYSRTEGWIYADGKRYSTTFGAHTVTVDSGVRILQFNR